MRLTPIKNHIIFQFVDEVDSKGQFVSKTSWGFTIPGAFDSSAKLPRWAITAAVGPDVENVVAGQFILIPALKWTEGFKVGTERFWKTDEKQVVAAKKKWDSELQVFRDTVVFERLPVKQTTSSIDVIGRVTDDTAKGKIVSAGPDCVEDLKKDVMFYFSDQNFFNEFEHAGKLWFISEPDILAYEVE